MLHRSRPSSAPRRSSISGAFSSFQSEGYAILWTAGLFSFIGVQMQFLLRGILAWDLTEREGALGLAYLCFGLSMLIATPLGGVAADRLSKRSILLGTQAVIMVAALSMGVAVITGAAQFWMLLIAGMAQGASFGFFGPARTAMSAELVGRDQLGNAITLTMLSMNGTRVFAPALAGVFAGIAFIGIGGAYLIAGVCSAASFLYLLRLPKNTGATVEAVSPATVDAGSADPSNTDTHADAPTPAPVPRANPFAEIKEGISYVLARPALARLVISSFFVIMFGFNYMAFLPALVKGEFGLGDTWVGIISSASAFGAVAVSLPLAAKADSPWSRVAMTAAGLAFGGGVVLFGMAGSFWLAFAVICCIGAATTIYQSLSNTLALTMSDDAHQGRVQSLMQLAFAGFGIAALPLGGLAEWLGLRPTIMLMGTVASLAMVTFAVLEGGWRGLRPQGGTDQTAETVERDTATDASTTLEDDGRLVGTPAAGS